METNQIKDLLYRIRKLEEVIQNNDYVKQEKYDILSKELDGIEKQLTELDKTYAVDKVRNKQLFETVNSLSQELENFKKSIKDDNNSKKEMGEKILLILLGSIVTFIMGRFSPSRARPGSRSWGGRAPRRPRRRRSAGSSP